MTSKRYRVYVGEAATEDVIKLASAYFDGATITVGTGIWQGERERTTTVEIVVSEWQANHDNVKAFARAACREFNQNCVLVTVEDVESELIS